MEDPGSVPETKTLMQRSGTEREWKRETIWRSCCLELDKRAALFFSQLFISAVIVVFCVTMLAYNQDCATFSRYSPLITFMVGIWLPQPQLRD
jgi:hypothetical protein